MVVTQVAKWGNSLGVRIPKSVLEDAQIQLNDEVIISYANNAIVIEKPCKELTIKDLFANYDASFHKEQELDYGEVVGEEIW